MRSILILILLSFSLYSQSLFDRWDRTDKLIRDRAIIKSDAVDSIKLYVELTKEFLAGKNFEYTKKVDWKFPLINWSEVTYRENGSDYRAKPFDYFQGGDSYGHPAHDIFILDKDSNVIEDKTGKKIEAVSMVNGVVISVYSEWQPGNKLRGGNYIKIYDPQTQAFFYYSHLDTVLSRVGDIVKAGDVVALVGRTGRKAVRGRTHLHVAYYKITNGYPKPKDIIDEIFESEKRYSK